MSSYRIRLVEGMLVAIIVCICGTAEARTIIMDASACDRMAGIAAAAPRLSWALREGKPGHFATSTVWLREDMSFLLRFPLESLPPGQRIAYAELIVNVAAAHGTDPRFYVWRILSEWGPGVGYTYRQTVPDKAPWVKPGARGLSSDRGTRPTDIMRVETIGEMSINVTEDVDLWYSGTAENHGWLLTVEDPDVRVEFPSPLWLGVSDWKLKITYEPIPDP